MSYVRMRRRAFARGRGLVEIGLERPAMSEALEPRLLLALVHIGSADASPNPTAPGGHSAHTIAQRIAAALAPHHPIPHIG